MSNINRVVNFNWEALKLLPVLKDLIKLIHIEKILLIYR
jgi:hypothetical protein